MTGVNQTLTTEEIRKRLGISIATFYRLRHRDPTFPKPIKALSSANKLMFSASDVARWLETAERG